MTIIETNTNALAARLHAAHAAHDAAEAAHQAEQDAELASERAYDARAKARAAWKLFDALDLAAADASV